MSIKSAIISEIQRLAAEADRVLPPLTDETVLWELAGIDSLSLAILVVRLEDTLGVDPFSDSGNLSFPVTLGDFIKAYENAGSRVL